MATEETELTSGLDMSEKDGDVTTLPQISGKDGDDIPRKNDSGVRLLYSIDAILGLQSTASGKTGRMVATDQESKRNDSVRQMATLWWQETNGKICY